MPSYSSGLRINHQGDSDVGWGERTVVFVDVDGYLCLLRSSCQSPCPRAGPMSGGSIGGLGELCKSDWNPSQGILELVAQLEASSEVWKVPFPGSSEPLSGSPDGLRMSFSSCYCLCMLGEEGA